MDSHFYTFYHILLLRRSCSWSLLSLWQKPEKWIMPLTPIILYYKWVRKRIVVKYFNNVKYFHIFDNKKGAKYRGITLRYDEFERLKSALEWMERADNFFTRVNIYKIYLYIQILIVSYSFFSNVHLPIYSAVKNHQYRSTN